MNQKKKLREELEGVVFDCDGTLVATHKQVIYGVAYALKNLTGQEVDEEMLERLYHPNLPLFYRRLEKELGIPLEKSAQKLYSLWSEYAGSKKAQQVELFDGVKELVETLHSHEVPLYLWTARDRGSTLSILKASGLAPYFWELRCGDDGPIKPSPWGLEQLVGHLGPQGIYVIGDSITDIQGAHSYGARSVAARWCEQAKRRPLEVEVDHIVEGPLDCLKIFFTS